MMVLEMPIVHCDIYNLINKSHRFDVSLFNKNMQDPHDITQINLHRQLV